VNLSAKGKRDSNCNQPDQKGCKRRRGGVRGLFTERREDKSTTILKRKGKIKALNSPVFYQRWRKKSPLRSSRKKKRERRG